MVYNWIYTTSNDNVYILILIIVILGLIILNFELYKKKTDKFYDIPGSTANVPTLSPELQALTQASVAMPTQQVLPTYQGDMWVNLDNNEETIAQEYNTQLPAFQNDIMQSNSDLFNTSNSSSTNSVQPINYNTMGDYATLDSLGSMMTDTLGGINTDLGYTILDDQLGTFKAGLNSSGNNSGTYDNTINYKTGMNSSTVDGSLGLSAYSSYSSTSSQRTGFSGQIKQDNRPVFLQKDFDGVANIFAPNIIIANPPLNDDGFPDISFQI
jgi:hypothetical protein